MSVPSERNVANKETEKLSKYKDLEKEVSKIWNMKTTTVPVIVGALGLIREWMITCQRFLEGSASKKSRRLSY